MGALTAAWLDSRSTSQRPHPRLPPFDLVFLMQPKVPGAAASRVNPCSLPSVMVWDPVLALQQIRSCTESVGACVSEHQLPIHADSILLKVRNVTQKPHGLLLVTAIHKIHFSHGSVVSRALIMGDYWAMFGLVYTIPRIKGRKEKCSCSHHPPIISKPSAYCVKAFPRIGTKKMYLSHNDVAARPTRLSNHYYY